MLSFVLGILHGLGTDHLMAIALLMAGKKRFRKLAHVGFEFGLAHIITLSFIGMAGLLFHWIVPVWFEKSAEIFGGVLLIILGLWTLSFLLEGKTHTHPHIHGRKKHIHNHFHFLSKHNHNHPHVLGVLFALSGLRSILLIVPVAFAQNMFYAVANILLFGIGIIISMSLFGVIAAMFFHLSKKIEMLHKLITFFTSYLSILTGVLWVVNF